MTKRRSGSRFLLVLVALCLAFLPFQRETALAQEPNRVALVVDFGEGRYITRCIEFTEDEITGEEVLKRSGLNVIFEYDSSYGAAVCKIEDVGCDFPSQSCFCQCQGSECVYWSYWYVENNKWVYSNKGADMRTVRDGDTEGWAWGSGSMGTSAHQPMWMPFLGICVPPTPTSTPSLTPTETPIPSMTPAPTVTFTPLPTATRSATPSRTPTLTRTPRPTYTPRPTGVLVTPTPWPTGTPPPSPPRIPTPTGGSAYPAPPTQQPIPSATPTQVPTQPPTPTQKPAYPAPPAAPPGSGGGTTPTAEPTVVLEVTQEVLEAPRATPSAAVAIETAEEGSIADRDVIAGRKPMATRLPREKPSIPPPRTSGATSASGEDVPWNYIFFGVILVGLLAGLAIVTLRRRPQQ